MTMHKRLLVFFSAILLPIVLFAAKPAKDTRVYAVKDGQELKMDIYTLPSETKMEQPCLMFVFGGGFKEGSRDAAEYTDYFTYFAERGFVVVSIDYRLGMKDAPAPGSSIPNRCAMPSLWLCPTCIAQPIMCCEMHRS